MSEGGHGSRTTFLEAEFDINIAPIVDCFTVLIAYLLVSASFLSLHALDVGVVLPIAPKTAVATEKGPLHMKLELKQDGIMQFDVTGAESQSLAIPLLSGQRDFKMLSVLMDHLRPLVGQAEATAVIWADPSVEYFDLVTALETVKSAIPSVFIGDTKTD